MLIETKNGKQVLLRRLRDEDFDNLSLYLQHLSEETRKRFGPHAFDTQSIRNLYTSCGQYMGYVAEEKDTQNIIAYSVVKRGYLEHDRSRLESYGIQPDGVSDCTFAPSVADEWQSCGVGDSLFGFILSDLKAIPIRRIILWGGVQADNRRAVNYYKKNGFSTLGGFWYNGDNYDMVLDVV